MIKFILGIWLSYLPFFALLVGLLFLYAFVRIFIESIGYKDSAYHKQTNKSFISIRFNQGAYGEYLIYKHLRDYEKNGAKFLFNVYVPKENGETTEIDVLLIDKSGIFVFESKNYSGWIFGSENQSQWTQTLPRGKGRSEKNRFFNPIIQNKGHIKHLKNVLGGSIPMYSIIAFSDRCELKNIKVSSADVVVINRSAALSRVEQKKRGVAELLSEGDILTVYNSLYPMTQVDDSVKEEHIRAIENKIQPTAKESIKEEPAPKEETAPKEDGDMLCPKCKSKLVARVARKGANAGKQFYGCSNYPNCRYTIDIN